MGLALSSGSRARINSGLTIHPIRFCGAMTKYSGIMSTLGKGRRSNPFVRCLVLGMMAAGAFLLPMNGTAEARIIKAPDGAVENDPRLIFGLIAEAMEQGDQQALADLVHEAGLRVTSGGNSERSTHYSPSQAFYYFKNLFQSHRTLVLTFDTMQDATAGDRVHGMALWKRRRPESDRVQEVKLVFVLSKQEDLWRLVEINKIR
jgi:hypothetical protein